jgi:hypothetical protein
MSDTITMEAEGYLDIEALSFPEELDFVAKQIYSQSDIWIRLQKQIQQSIPNATISNIRQFGVRSLWEEFCVKKRHVKRLNDGQVNTRLLFHGTAEPKYITGTGFGENGNGFDPNKGHQGSYGKPGCAIYFAEHAFYPIKVISATQKWAVWNYTEFTLFAAEVIIGSQYDYGDSTAPSLDQPPKKCASESIFDSVQGTENSIATKRGGRQEWGLQHVVFEKSRAYPHFVIKLRLPTPSGVHVGNQMIQIGPFRIGRMLNEGKDGSNPEDDHLCVGHQSGNNIQIFRADGTLHPGSHKNLNPWTKDLGEPGGVSIGSGEGLCSSQSHPHPHVRSSASCLIQIGPFFIGRMINSGQSPLALNGDHLCVGHQSGNSIQIFRADGTLHPGTCHNIWNPANTNAPVQDWSL